MNEYASQIAGGIEVVPDKIVSGGNEMVVGENTKWFMRDKFLQYSHLTKKNADEKSLLKIIGLSIPISFNREVYFDDNSKKIPQKSKKQSDSEIHEKAIQILEKRLREQPHITVKRLVNEYNLRAPLFWVLSDIVKYLILLNKKKNPNARKTKISPNMAVIIEKIWGQKNYFQYVVNSDDVPNNMIDLMVHILKKIKHPKGEWKEPKLIKHTYPSISDQVRKRIENEQKKTGKNNDVKDFVLSVITIENILIDHIDAIEKYYIIVAKNMKIIFDGLKIFYKKT